MAAAGKSIFQRAAENGGVDPSEIPDLEIGHKANPRSNAPNESNKAARKKDDSMPDEASSEPRQLLMPYWSETIRALPNEMLRSALFTVRNVQSEREFLDGRVIATYEKKVQMTYTGMELRQSPDGDVFLQLLHMAQNQPPGTWIEFSRADMLRALGWSSSSRDYERLHDAIGRMNTGSLGIICPRLIPIPENNEEKAGKSSQETDDPSAGDEKDTKKDTIQYQFTLIPAFQAVGPQGRGRRWKVKLAPELVALFSDNQFSLLSWEVRRQLKPFGKWLHGYLSTHREPLPFTVEMCMRNSGSQANTEQESSRKDWADHVLLPALEDLKALGFLDDFEFFRASERVRVKRSPLFNS